MNMTSRGFFGRARATTLLLLSGTMTFQFGISACRNLTQFLNPCETVFPGSDAPGGGICDEEDLDRLNGTIPDFQNDPTCSIPFACSDDPPFGSFGPGPRPSGPP